MKKITFLMMCVLSAFMLNAQTEIFFETFGTTAPTSGTRPIISAYTGWDNQAPIVFSSSTADNADVRATTNTSSHVWFPAAKETDLIISNIALSGYTNLELSFKIATNAGAANLVNTNTDKLTFYFNGTQIIVPSLTFTAQNAYTEVSLTLPDAATGQLRFLYTVANNPTNYGFRLDDVKITGTPTTITKVFNPVITPGSSTVYESTQVSITTATENATIYYTTDGTDPSTSSTVYSAPFTVSTTTTVKAFATATGLTNSDIVSATLSFPSQVADIASFLAVEDNDIYQITNPVTAVYQKGSNLYVKDDNAWMLVYGGVSGTYVNGDQLTGLAGTLGAYGRAPQMSVKFAPAATAGTAVNPISMTSAELDTLDLAKYVKLTNVKFSADVTYSTSATVNGILTDGLTVRDNFRNGGEVLASKNYDITGFVNAYFGVVQLYPVLIEENTGTSTETTEVDDMKIYVSNNSLTISKADGQTAEIYSATGAKIISTTVQNGSISISDLNSGVYVVRVAGKTAKFVK